MLPQASQHAKHNKEQGRWKEAEVKGLQIRKRIEKDKNEIIHLLNQAANELARVSGVQFPPGTRQLADSYGFDGLVALQDGKVVGTVAYRVRSRRMHIFDFVVHASCRGKGVGNQLLAELEKIGAESRVRSLSLQTLEESGAISAFENMGFKKQSAKPEFLFATPGKRALTTVYMVKRLAEKRTQQPGRWW